MNAHGRVIALAARCTPACFTFPFVCRALVPAAFLVPLLLPALASAQTQIHGHAGVPAGSFKERLGAAVAGVGDVDKDGFGDYLVGAPLGGDGNVGRAMLYSGKYGHVLRTFEGGEGGALLGAALSGCGDVNADGVLDYVIGSPEEYGGHGDAVVVSGKTGANLFSVFQDDPCGAPNTQCGVGTSVSGAGDINGDGKPDVIIGAPQFKTHGLALVYSFHPKMARLHTIVGSTTFSGVGNHVSGAGDVDGDGNADFFVASKTTVHLLSGKTGALIRARSGTGAVGLGLIDGDKYADYAVWDASLNIVVVYSGKTHTSMFKAWGTSATAAGDIDADGVPDLLVRFANDSVRAYSVKKKQQLLAVRGIAMGGAGDVNGDGHADVITGEPDKDFGIATVHSGVPMPLWVDRHLISQATGGTQTLHLRAPEAYAGKSYLMVGTLSGTDPGVMLPGGVTIPINVDFYTHFTISNPSAIFNGMGKLLANGAAQATVEVPKGLPLAVIGYAAHHAYLVFDANGFYYMASNPVAALLVK